MRLMANFKGSIKYIPLAFVVFLVCGRYTRSYQVRSADGHSRNLYLCIHPAQSGAGKNQVTPQRKEWVKR